MCRLLLCCVEPLLTAQLDPTFQGSVAAHFLAMLFTVWGDSRGE
jgi:hypothetical protein